MTASITVSPATPAAPAPAVSLSADTAKLYADALAEAKGELASVEAALTGKISTTESAVSAWLKAHEPAAVGILLAALILAIRFHVL
jgi:hypothetical protein